MMARTMTKRSTMRTTHGAMSRRPSMMSLKPELEETTVRKVTAMVSREIIMAMIIDTAMIIITTGIDMIKIRIEIEDTMVMETKTDMEATETDTEATVTDMEETEIGTEETEISMMIIEIGTATIETAGMVKMATMTLDLETEIIGTVIQSKTKATLSLILTWEEPHPPPTTIMIAMTDARDPHHETGPTRIMITTTINITTKTRRAISMITSRIKTIGVQRGRLLRKLSPNRRNPMKSGVHTKSSRSTKKNGRRISLRVTVRCHHRPAKQSSKGQTLTSNVKEATTPTATMTRAMTRKRITRDTWMLKKERTPGRDQERRESIQLAVTSTMTVTTIKKSRSKPSRQISSIWGTRKRNH